MKVSNGEAYQYAMLIIASIAAFDMQGGSRSNIILYTRVKKWFDNYVMTPQSCIQKIVCNVFTEVSVDVHAHFKPENY